MTATLNSHQPLRAVCVPMGRELPADPESLLSVMKQLTMSSSKPDASALQVFDLYEMTGQGGDADKVMPTLVKAKSKL